jgi:hypothetical protein
LLFSGLGREFGFDLRGPKQRHPQAPKLDFVGFGLQDLELPLSLRASSMQGQKQTDQGPIHTDLGLDPLELEYEQTHSELQEVEQQVWLHSGQQRDWLEGHE